MKLELDVNAVNFILQTLGELPTKTGAWELVDGKVLVNISKAKEVTKKRLRAERNPLLQAQDVAFQRALESGVNTSAIVAEKQRLCDLPTLSDQATTLDELRALKA
jgi:hypothetical protein